jgi:hypothetical protein
MASLLDLAQARLGGLLAPQKPSMAGLLGGQRTQGNIASVLQGYTPPQMTALTNPQVIDYARNVAQSAQQNLQTQMSDLDKAIVMGQGGIQVGDREALARLMEQVPGLMGATAYHGTPHTIRGKFDISKVGTGEGAQAYGHGMYFAENPAVAKMYQAALSDTKYKVGERELKGNEAWAAQFLHDFQGDALPKRIDVNTAIEKANQTLKDSATKQEVINNIKALDKSGLSVESGNLYKVDIPDADIPNMLNWDEPLSKQPKSVQDALAKFDPDLYSKKGSDYSPEERGESIYMRIANSQQAKNFPEASAVLESLGIKGIRYLDEGSRNPAVQPYYQLIRKSDNAVYTQMQDLKSAEEFVKNAKKQGVDFEISAPVDKRTSNFVVFEPSNVKILEKNSQKVEGLLD